MQRPSCAETKLSQQQRHTLQLYSKTTEAASLSNRSHPYPSLQCTSVYRPHPNWAIHTVQVRQPTTLLRFNAIQIFTPPCLASDIYPSSVASTHSKSQHLFLSLPPVSDTHITSNTCDFFLDFSLFPSTLTYKKKKKKKKKKIWSSLSTSHNHHSEHLSQTKRILHPTMWVPYHHHPLHPHINVYLCKPTIIQTTLVNSNLVCSGNLFEPKPT